MNNFSEVLIDPTRVDYAANFGFIFLTCLIDVQEIFRIEKISNRKNASIFIDMVHHGTATEG